METTDNTLSAIHPLDIPSNPSNINKNDHINPVLSPLNQLTLNSSFPISTDKYPASCPQQHSSRAIDSPSLKESHISHQSMSRQRSLPLTPILNSTSTMSGDNNNQLMPNNNINNSLLPPANSPQPRQRHHSDHPEIQHHTSPQPSRLSLPNKSRSYNCKSQLTAIIPSDTTTPTTSKSYTGPPSSSPSTWSFNSSECPTSASSSIIENKPRFERLTNGGHRHNLYVPKRYQFLSNQVKWLKELLEGRKERDDLSPVSSQGQQPHKAETFDNPLSILNEKYQEVESDQSISPASSHQRRISLKSEFTQKYGEVQQVVGKGAFGTVRLSLKRNSETGEEIIYAIKEFKYTYGESHKQYMRRLTSEFCIASSLQHKNVIQTLDLVQLHEDLYSEVMEYCTGGDLHSLISSADTLGEIESNCFFSQLMHGVAFLHSMGVVHRDLKPENLLLTGDGCLKICDFGNSEVFRMPWEKKVRSSASIRGSGPFIAPEEFTTETFDARKVDIWACGIVYMCMRFGKYIWYEAQDGEPIWDSFLYKRERLLEQQQQQQQQDIYDPEQLSHLNLTALEQSAHLNLLWPTHIMDVLETILEPNPKQRTQAINVLDSEWLKHADNCHPTSRPPDQVLDESEFGPPTPSPRKASRVVPAGHPACQITK